MVKPICFSSLGNTLQSHIFPNLFTALKRYETLKNIVLRILNSLQQVTSFFILCKIFISDTPKVLKVPSIFSYSYCCEEFTLILRTEVSWMRRGKNKVELTFEKHFWDTLILMNEMPEFLNSAHLTQLPFILS